ARLILENGKRIYSTSASHNVRTISSAATHARILALKTGDYEFQMLYGMAGLIRRALKILGYRVREYCPIGELVPGMAYLVRRLLENTSNEGFLRARFRANKSIAELLTDPLLQIPDPQRTSPQCAESPDKEPPAEIRGATLPKESRFQNQPPSDFAVVSARNKFGLALDAVRGK